MDNKFALFLALLLIVAFVADMLLFDFQGIVGIGRMLVGLITWLAAWR